MTVLSTSDTLWALLIIEAGFVTTPQIADPATHAVNIARALVGLLAATGLNVTRLGTRTPAWLTDLRTGTTRADSALITVLFKGTG